MLKASASGAAIAIVALAPLVACAQSRAPLDPRIKAEIDSVDTQIKAAEEEDARYAGGLIKAVVESRVATLKQTRAMLAQRATAGDLNVMLRYTVDGKAFTPPADTSADLAAVEAELASLKTKLSEAETEAAQYSGGLVQAMALTTVETVRQSQAMLEQKRIALKFGLPQFVGFTANNPAAPAPSPSVNPVTTQPAAAQDWEIVSVDSKVTETNDVWWKYAWKLTIRNKGAASHAFRAKIEFQDKDGFIIDTNDSDTFAVQPNTDDTATGFALIRVPGATSVARTLAKVQVVR